MKGLAGQTGGAHPNSTHERSRGNKTSGGCL